MNDRIFLDTNILIYSFDRDEPNKYALARDLLFDSSSEFVISYQVVQELINVLIKKKTKDSVIKLLLEEVIFPMWEINPTQEIYLKALDIRSRWLLSHYDSLIVAAALEAKCPIIYSEDMQHGLKIYETEIVNPFKI